MKIFKDFCRCGTRSQTPLDERILIKTHQFKRCANPLEDRWGSSRRSGPNTPPLV